MTGATPDGRRAGEPLSKNLGAAIAKDRRGVAALLHSAAKLDQAEFPDGAVLDVMLHPSMVKGKEGPKVVADLVRTYFEAGGLFIQFNILDVDTLRRARREPEKYQLSADPRLRLERALHRPRSGGAGAVHSGGGE